ncbi:MAG: hypothetical protein DRQ88_03450 [Epsilonproteobacteria bacterium]|nr:MAG: hypothetical protein DRQ89_01310 [Campylobacterota bacterium]RLA67375.1 MAG: hypothetical protein DRQ88_03450 [Campylobacterota bacterium]
MKKLLIFFLFTSLQAHAFTFNNNIEARFEDPSIVVNINGADCENSQLDPDTLYQMAYDAVTDYWNQVPSSSLFLKMGTITEDATNTFYTEPICSSQDPCVPNENIKVDKYILISCNDDPQNFPSKNILGLTLTNNISGGYIRGALFLLNDTPGNLFNDLSRDEIVAVIAHEIGHAVGLGHSPTEDALMYFSLIPKRRSVGGDDIAGVTYLYPKEQPFGIISCASIDTGGGPHFFFPFLLGLALISFIIRKVKIS